MWHTRNKAIEFDSKAFAFDYMNKVKPEVDDIYLFCDGELRYTKSHLGLYNVLDQYYVKGLLPVEHYV